MQLFVENHRCIAADMLVFVSVSDWLFPAPSPLLQLKVLVGFSLFLLQTPSATRIAVL